MAAVNTGKLFRNRRASCRRYVANQFATEPSGCRNILEFPIKLAHPARSERCDLCLRRVDFERYRVTSVTSVTH